MKDAARAGLSQPAVPGAQERLDAGQRLTYITAYPMTVPRMDTSGV